MIALTVRQPWASLIVHGVKTIETRSWHTNIRGLIAIHASKHPYESITPVTQKDIWYYLAQTGVDPAALPLGVVLGTACLVNSRPAHGSDFPAPEIPLGLFGVGRFAWELTHPMRLCKPIPASGKLGFWNLPKDVSDTIYAEYYQHFGGEAPDWLPGFCGITGQPMNGNPEHN